MLEVKNLSVNFGDKILIDKLNLALNKGEIMAICGDNGSGKSTLLYTLANLLPKEASYSGDVVYNEKSVFDMSIAEKCENIGLVLQEPDTQIFSSNVISEIVFGLENLCYEQSTLMEKLDEILEKLSIQKYKNKGTNELSRGEQQLVCIASVMVMKPKVLLADEIFSAIDNNFAPIIWKVLKDYVKEGNMIILVTHSQSILDNCDKIITLKGGSYDKTK